MVAIQVATTNYRFRNSFNSSFRPPLSSFLGNLRDNRDRQANLDIRDDEGTAGGVVQDRAEQLSVVLETFESVVAVGSQALC